MRLGIVGAEEAKFTERGREEAYLLIDRLVTKGEVKAVVSGKCHLGGIDIWAVNIARSHSIPVVEYPPIAQDWSTGYKPRNILIAKNSDMVVCITVARFANAFTGRKFPYCYHCKRADHVKSGGCWTVKFARALGKAGEILIVANEEN